ncbi:MAG: LysM peptidoglycan-binding domain-containing protein, partial [Anaerolineae bacterium]|nr:LysM peptidoglycan-binding domain-containing protein [Anaerolineae bacterium]
MGYWGWRTLVMIVAVSVWITGCTIATTPASSIPPTEPPSVTLTVRRREPTPTPVTLTLSLTPTTDANGTTVADAGLEIYNVRPGDTLLGIALDFGIPLESLRAANPDVDPRQLQVGQVIHIPPASFLPQPTTTPALTLTLAPPSCHELPTGHTL